MFYGQEMSLVDNYDTSIDERYLDFGPNPSSRWIETMNAIIKDSGYDDLDMKAKFWGIIFGEKNEEGNWY